MKKYVLILLVGLPIFGQSNLNSFSNNIFEKEYVQVIEKVDNVKGLDEFLHDLGKSESGNVYDVVNTFGYMGKYQFGHKTLKGLGYDVSKEEFLSSPYIQEVAMMDLLRHNQKILKKYIDYWDGKKIKGKLVTESGILAAAHLAGPTNVKRYFMYGKDPNDGYGTKLSTYLFKFSNYKLNIDDEDKIIKSRLRITSKNYNVEIRASDS